MGIVSAVGATALRRTWRRNTGLHPDRRGHQPGQLGRRPGEHQGEVIGSTPGSRPRPGEHRARIRRADQQRQEAINDFINKGKVEYGWLGVQIADPNPETYPGVAKDLRVDAAKGRCSSTCTAVSPASGRPPAGRLHHPRQRAGYPECEQAHPVVETSLPTGRTIRIDPQR